MQDRPKVSILAILGLIVAGLSLMPVFPCLLTMAISVVLHERQAMLPCFIAGPAAGLLLGCLAVFRIRRSSGKLRGTSSAGIAIVLSLLASAMVPFHFRYYHDARASSCVSNLSLIDHCKEVLAIKNKWPDGHIIADTPEAIWTHIDPYVDGTNMLQCPLLPPGTHYIYGPIDTSPKCPYGGDHVYSYD